LSEGVVFSRPLRALRAKTHSLVNSDTAVRDDL